MVCTILSFFLVLLDVASGRHVDDQELLSESISHSQRGHMETAVPIPGKVGTGGRRAITPDPDVIKQAYAMQQQNGPWFGDNPGDKDVPREKAAKTRARHLADIEGRKRISGDEKGRDVRDQAIADEMRDVYKKLRELQNDERSMELKYKHLEYKVIEDDPFLPDDWKKLLEDKEERASRIQELSSEQRQLVWGGKRSRLDRHAPERCDIPGVVDGPQVSGADLFSDDNTDFLCIVSAGSNGQCSSRRTNDFLDVGACKHASVDGMFDSKAEASFVMVMKKLDAEDWAGQENACGALGEIMQQDSVIFITPTKMSYMILTMDAKTCKYPRGPVWKDLYGETSWFPSCRLGKMIESGDDRQVSTRVPENGKFYQCVGAPGSDDDTCYDRLHPTDEERADRLRGHRDS